MSWHEHSKGDTLNRRARDTGIFAEFKFVILFALVAMIGSLLFAVALVDLVVPAVVFANPAGALFFAGILIVGGAGCAWYTLLKRMD